jgi:predicted RNA polymerase sigma factor
MELQASRAKARVAADGTPILLLDQDRSRWDRLQIARGLAALDRAQRRIVAAGETPGPYLLQAAIAACHARARRADDTDWARIAALYGALARIVPSPVVELNRAVAVAQAQGPAAALPLLDALHDAPALRDYALLHAARGDVLLKLQRRDEARAAFARAAALAGNARDRALMQARARACADA